MTNLDRIIRTNDGLNHMRVFALSDVHVEYQGNSTWIRNLSDVEFQQDVLILAGDVTHDLSLLIITFEQLLSKC